MPTLLLDRMLNSDHSSEVYNHSNCSAPNADSRSQMRAKSLHEAEAEKPFEEHQAVRKKGWHLWLVQGLCLGGASKALKDNKYLPAAALLGVFAAVEISAASSLRAHSIAHIAEGLHRPTFGRSMFADGLQKIIGKGIAEGGQHVGKGVDLAGASIKGMRRVEVYASL